MLYDLLCCMICYAMLYMLVRMPSRDGIPPTHAPYVYGIRRVWYTPIGRGPGPPSGGRLRPLALGIPNTMRDCVTVTHTCDPYTKYITLVHGTRHP